MCSDFGGSVFGGLLFSGGGSVCPDFGGLLFSGGGSVCPDFGGLLCSGEGFDTLLCPGLNAS